MTDQTLTIVLNNIPTILGAVFAGVAALYGAATLRKGKENSDKVDVGNTKTDEVAVKAEQIHALAEDNLPGLTKTVERHEAMLQELHTDVAEVKMVVDVVRERQHEIAQYFQQIGGKFELSKMPEFKPRSGD